MTAMKPQRENPIHVKQMRSHEETGAIKAEVLRTVARITQLPASRILELPLKGRDSVYGYDGLTVEWKYL